MEVQGDSFPDTRIQHASELWFIPEIERRRSAGSLPEGFTLWAAQVVMDIDTPGPLVRLNEEIRGVFEAEAPRKIDAGEIVRLGDLGDIKAMHLTADDPNAGHLTVLLHNQPDERSTFCRDKFRGNTAWAPPDLQGRKGRFHPGIPYGILDVDH